ncbi:putative nucleosome assembly protein [Hypsibius exemplaris]|uniref:Nucleosome assembly protein n=1 Tax=Hypsibius exemplaris TaxID=2072580 RepID=A0A1W0W912_HYPEX|nr:putative nucleosome assembly protein [Hypsibius exemplaris]
MSGKQQHKENGQVKSPAKCPPGPHKHGAGDEEDSASEHSHIERMPLPENIHKRLNALKNIHIDIQKKEQEMYTKLFLLEAEQHKKLAPLLARRAEIITGKYEPSGAEVEFVLKADEDEKEELGPANELPGIPEFWLTVLASTMHTAQLINEDDHEALKYLVDVRAVYADSPLGFTLEFEFKENPFFTNTVLTRSYKFGSEVDKDELYVSSGLAPKTTEGCVINWKPGKDTSKKETTTSQRNKKTGEKRQIKKVEDQDSFFQFFKPAVTDLTSLAKVIEESDEAAAEALAEKAEQAELDFELASYIRTRMIPRALLLYTGDDDEDGDSYGGDEDYDDDEDDDEDDEDDGAGDESDSDDSGDAGKKTGKGGKVSKGVARR